jgi:hypothetical protein
MKIFIEGDYSTTIECMTVIEGSAAEISRERKDDLIKALKDTERAWINEKKNLTLELLSILEK